VEVCIVDYGFGNIWSLRSAINFLGFKCSVTSNPKEILHADKLILPGVGAFKSAMASLEEKRLATAIVSSVIHEGHKILGICLGMQIMAEMGFENGQTKGLGLFSGEIRPMDSSANLKVPHIGFNEVEANPESKLFRDLPKKSDFYFVHSYQLNFPPKAGVSAFTNYGRNFVSAFESDNVFATQFHPEKSQSNGLKVLKNFLELPHA
jgi:imidazole glycerol-phosphate synthase subunit HisH